MAGGRQPAAHMDTPAQRCEGEAVYPPDPGRSSRWTGYGGLFYDWQWVEVAVGMLAARYREDIEEARGRLHLAGQRAAVDPIVVARVVILTHEGR